MKKDSKNFASNRNKLLAYIFTTTSHLIEFDPNLNDCFCFWFVVLSTTWNQSESYSIFSTEFALPFEWFILPWYFSKYCGRPLCAVKGTSSSGRCLLKNPTYIRQFKFNMIFHATTNVINYKLNKWSYLWTYLETHT